MFPQDEYRRTFGPSPVINSTLEATTQSITHQQPLCTPPAAQLRWNRRSAFLVGAPQPLLNLFYFILLSIPPFSALHYPIPHSIPPFQCSSAWDGSSSISTGALIRHSTLFIHTILALLLWDKHSPIPSVLRC